MLRRRLFSILLILAGTCTVLLISLSLNSFLVGRRWMNEPLHSTMEALGGLSAIAMAIVLFQRSVTQADARWQAPAVGFLAMGILEEFHALSTQGNAFILLRSLASFCGAAGFSLIWILAPLHDRPKGRWLPWSVAGAVLAIGLTTVVYHDHLPEMLRNGDFSPTAIAPTSLACLLFFTAAWRFLLDFRRSGSADDYLFGCLAVMFGTAELMFTYSVLWDSRWWFWHFLRLAAYLLVLGHVANGYRLMVRRLKASLAQTRAAEETARRSEQHLRNVLEERERMAQDLHDGIIQSIFALGLSLERCQRLVKKDPEEVVAQLTDAVTDLKSVIRDLRHYITGTEPHEMDGRVLEAALAAQIRAMERAHGLRFTFEADPAAIELITGEQAGHILSVVREAMSNSLRHANARAGTVSLTLHEGRVRLVMTDDGIGFDPEAVRGGEGLKNMAARARKLHARLTVRSEPGRGTRVEFELPKEVHA